MKIPHIKKHWFGLLLWAIYLLVPLSLEGKHIVGGEITYQCLGNGTYILKMRVFRDCNSGGADFDDFAALSIYQTGAGGGANLLSTLQVPHLPKVKINIGDDPCFEEPDVCVEEAIYISEVITLPVLTTGSYVVTYQRCCRNNTISNIVNPEGSGASYSVEITAEAQQSCNNSPVFNDFPPIVICANAPLIFDHSATDIDGDQLVYELCSPLLGGGLVGSNGYPGNPNSFNGVQPDPAAPPPYDPVVFVDPPYDAGNPMGGNPAISINPQTGVISGIPTTLGQFVVGVCVSEYRNGTLLSTIRRDFQFNVMPCTPYVFADIEEDEIIGPNEYLINSCGNNTVTFKNQSIQASNIFSYDWSFDLGNGQVFESQEKDPTVVFPDTGTYAGILVLNRGSECSDSAIIYVNVYPEVVANFDYDYDTCTVGPVNFEDLSYAESGELDDWYWDFSDGSKALLSSPDHLFSEAGDWEVVLRVKDINGCTDDTLQMIRWYPIPELLIVEPTQYEGCAPVEVFFNNLSFPINDSYQILWDFGDGGTDTVVSPSYIYEDPGIYSVSLEVLSPVGCYNEAEFTEWIEILPSPRAGFDYSPKELSNFSADVSFFDESLDAASWYWEFSDLESSYEQEPKISFADTGQVEVMQVVTHQSGCRDTAYAVLDIVPRITFFMPNAFTPNLDNKNDVFKGQGYFDWARDYEMTIWNRWGEQVFYTNDPQEGWDGRKNNTGAFSPQGVYLYLVRFSGPRGDRFEYRGFATLIN